MRGGWCARLSAPPRPRPALFAPAALRVALALAPARKGIHWAQSAARKGAEALEEALLGEGEQVEALRVLDGDGGGAARRVHLLDRERRALRDERLEGRPLLRRQRGRAEGQHRLDASRGARGVHLGGEVRQRQPGGRRGARPLEPWRAALAQRLVHLPRARQVRSGLASERGEGAVCGGSEERADAADPAGARGVVQGGEAVGVGRVDAHAVGREEGGEALLVVPLGGAVQRGALVVVCRLCGGAGGEEGAHVLRRAEKGGPVEGCEAGPVLLVDGGAGGEEGLDGGEQLVVDDGVVQRSPLLSVGGVDVGALVEELDKHCARVGRVTALCAVLHGEVARGLVGGGDRADRVALDGRALGEQQPHRRRPAVLGGQQQRRLDGGVERLERRALLEGELGEVDGVVQGEPVQRRVLVLVARAERRARLDQRPRGVPAVADAGGEQRRAHLAILHADRGTVGEEELDALDVVQLRREVQRRLLACASLVDVAALLRHEMLHALGVARVQCLEELGGRHSVSARVAAR
mmetsp:Transcript_51256/g.165329  ORF Transcript_51256/g.165329 Transcript_51256/m.165329 type:complete len:525 (+) Transcript_51256:120-1694(+)